MILYDSSDRDYDIAAMMVYTGWDYETAKAAVDIRHEYEPDWNARYVLDYLHLQEIERIPKIVEHIKEYHK